MHTNIVVRVWNRWGWLIIMLMKFWKKIYHFFDIMFVSFLKPLKCMGVCMMIPRNKALMECRSEYSGSETLYEMQMYHNTVKCCNNAIQYNMGQVTELRLSRYLVLLSIDSTKPGNKLAPVSWHDLYDIAFIAAVTEAEYKSKFGPKKYTFHTSP